MKPLINPNLLPPSLVPDKPIAYVQNIASNPEMSSMNFP
jgi:hypothetical protein